MKNYHDATVESCMELIGAMGMDNPDLLAAHQILQRVDDETTRTFDEIYVPLRANELLSDSINSAYSEHWSRAQSGCF